MVPTIQNPGFFDLPPQGETILQLMFADYKRIVIKAEYSGGFSGSRVFLIRPIKHDDTPALPTVVKMASVSLIEKEWQAYQSCIHDRLPDVAEVKGQPILLAGSDWGGLRYALVGDGTSKIEPFHEYCCRADITDLRFVMENQLLNNLKQIWRFGRQTYPELPLRVRYDRVLPVNLLLNPQPLPPDKRAIHITPTHLPHPDMLQVGDYVKLEGFIVTKVDLIRQTMTLNLPTPEDGSRHSYTARLQSLEGMAACQVNQIIPPIIGVVVETRQSRLQAETLQVLGSVDMVHAAEVALSNGLKLPNPLQALPHILNGSHHVWVSYIHGDLNLGNILVAPETREVGLIDFAEARQDYVLHDFLRLETEVMSHVVAEIIRQHDLPPALTVYNFYQQLYWATQHDNATIPPLPHPNLVRPFVILVALRQTVRRYLFNFDDYGEYYQGLIMYLMGALKFRNLDALTKQVAFWGAATTQQLLTNPPAKPPVLPISRRKVYSVLLLLPLAIASTAWLGWSQFVASSSVTSATPTPTQKVTLLTFTSPLPTITPTATPTTAPPTATMTSSATHTATPTPSATATPTQTPSLTTTPQPATFTPSATPTPIIMKQTLPTLISPESGSNLSYYMNTFTWSGEPLAENQAFELRIWKGDESHYGAYDAREMPKQPNAQGQYSFSFNVSSAPSVRDNGNGSDYFWSVAIVQITPNYQDLGLETEPRPLQINVFGHGSNPSNPDPSSGRPDPGPLP